MLSIANKPFMQCRYAECRYTECRYTEYNYAASHGATLYVRCLWQGEIGLPHSAKTTGITLN